MVIGIDGNEANQKIRVGSGIYAFNILWEIYKQIKNEKLKIKNDSVKFRIYLKTIPLNDLPQENNVWQYQVVKPEAFWTQIGLPVSLWIGKIKNLVPDIFFTLSHYAPRFCPTLSVITIFDLSFIRFPEMFLKKDLYQLKNWTAYSVAQAKRIITISEFSKREMIDHYKLSPNKVVVCYPGYDEVRFNIKIKNQKSKIKNTKKKLKIEGEYLLYVGTIQPRKNLVRLVEAFQKLRIKNLKLVIAGMVKEGRGGWMQEGIINKIKNDIIMTGYVDDDDLPYLMAGAKAFVLPSLYEGFGIPALEVMACGVPVVISKTSSLPEVCGKVAIYIEDPYSVKSISSALNKALTLSGWERKNLIELGLAQAKKFSWEKTGEIVLKMLLEKVYV